MSNVDNFDINDLRNEIDKIDASLLSLFENRMELVLKIGEYKKKNNMEILNGAREEAVIKKNLDLVKNSNLHLEVEEFFKAVMEISRGLQNKNHRRKNIVLIGMPGSGKSTIGEILAEKLGMSFLDIDTYIEKSTNLKITEIFKNGEDLFRDIEAKAVLEVSERVPAVISTGGGVIKRYDNIKSLKKNGIIIYINRPIKNIVGDIEVKTRPLLSKDPSQLYLIFEERGPLYKKYCDYEIMNISNTYDVVNNIIEIYAENNK
ncbi:chorismate mutase [Clostridium sp. FP1]|uniref:chorismate mutase n=1 Tax=Clostridium sp. FP1 TaxID=2724076 RepID=UPI0013E98A94|nr:chorismate mutase [Clostridium sp. FP1]